MHAYWKDWSEKLSAHDENPHRLMHWVLRGMGVDEPIYCLNYDELSPLQQEKLDNSFQRLLRNEPISKILESIDFFDRPFKTTRATLDPRLDTEVMIEYALRTFSSDQSYKFLDLGTGTGCIIITLLLAFQKARGVGVDISPDALKIAHENRMRHQVDSRLELVHSDWFERVPQQFFDAIFSNPPYIEKDYPLDLAVHLYDPHIALFGGDDGLSEYRNIIQNVKPYCKPHTLLIFEIGVHQEKALIDIAQQHHFDHVETVMDQQGHARVVSLRLMV